MFNVRAHLLLHILRLYCMNHETEEGENTEKEEKQMNNYLILGRSNLAPFL